MSPRRKTGAHIMSKIIYDTSRFLAWFGAFVLTLVGVRLFDFMPQDDFVVAADKA